MTPNRFVSAAAAAEILNMPRSTFDWQRARSAFVADPLTGEVVGSYDEQIASDALEGEQQRRRYAEAHLLICPLFGGRKPPHARWRFDRLVLESASLGIGETG